MKFKQKLMRAIMIFVVMLNIFNIVSLPIPYKEKFDKSTAGELLKESFIPLEDFIKAGTPVEGEELLLVPTDVRNEKDFIGLFNNKIDNKVGERFFQDLVIEKLGVLYIDKLVYIPMIHEENGMLTNSYIKQRKSSLYSRILGENEIIDEKLVIKEKWKISGEWHRRSNYFVKNENGQWILDHFTGTTLYKFVDSNHNPWSYY